MGQHDAPLTVDPDPNEVSDVLTINATYPALPWGCPETMTIEIDSASKVAVASLAELVYALAGVPNAARAGRDDPTLFDAVTHWPT
jgi:hypothetical protein